MKLQYLAERLMDIHNAHPDAEVYIAVDDATDRMHNEQVVIMECDTAIYVLLCETAIMDEK